MAGPMLDACNNLKQMKAPFESMATNNFLLSAVTHHGPQASAALPPSATLSTASSLLAPKSAVVGLFAPCWANLGWPTATIVLRFGLWCYRTFCFYMDPQTNGGGPGYPRLALFWGPTGEDFAVFQAGMGWLKNRDF